MPPGFSPGQIESRSFCKSEVSKLVVDLFLIGFSPYFNIFPTNLDT